MSDCCLLTANYIVCMCLSYRILFFLIGLLIKKIVWTQSGLSKNMCIIQQTLFHVPVCFVQQILFVCPFVLFSIISCACVCVLFSKHCFTCQCLLFSKHCFMCLCVSFSKHFMCLYLCFIQQALFHVPVSALFQPHLLSGGPLLHQPTFQRQVRTNGVNCSRWSLQEKEVK